MNRIVIQAASCIGPGGFGNDVTGLKPWPGSLGEALGRGELEALRWSTLFESDASRFARMDWVSRVGLMAVELLDLPFAAWEPERREGTAVLVETCGGSITSDASFLRFPRPTVFAYTLPSTVIGEICIRHRFKGPVLCLMSAAGFTRAAVDEAVNWLREGEAACCVCVDCEAVDREAAALLPATLPVPVGGWQGHALVLGAARGEDRERPLPPGTLAEICLNVCRKTA